MKKNKLKKLSIFALTTALTVSCLAGCGKKKEEDTEQATITTEAAATMSDADIEFAPTKEGYVINEFSGEWIDESLSNQRPLCIMINNIVDAMPQSGISQADITYEMLVEGGITRYMCVFKDYSNLEKLGPVRSARHYYVQMANMLGGTELIRRKLGKDAYAMTITLLLNSEGKKMGKTQSGAVWLDPEKTSPFDFYQYWRNVDDADVIKCMRLLTFLPLEEIDEMAKWEGSQLNKAKEILAYELTNLVHGEEEAKKAQEGARALFAGGADTAHMPTTELADEDFSEEGTIDLISMLVKAGMVPTRSEGRRAIEQGGVSIDGEKITDVKYTVAKDALTGEGVVLKKGKKKFNKVLAK